MSAFEFVFGVIAIISSLALTQIITGVVAILRHKDRAGFSLVHALWMWIAFADGSARYLKYGGSWIRRLGPQSNPIPGR